MTVKSPKSHHKHTIIILQCTPEVAPSFSLTGWQDSSRASPFKNKRINPTLQNVGMKPPWVRLAFWENKIPLWGVCYRPDGCTPKISHTGGSRAEEEEAWPPGKVEERVWKEEGEVVREGREELMPTAQQRLPPSQRPEKSTGKELRSRGPQGVQVQGDCQCLHFNSRATPSEYLYFHLQQQPHPHISIYSPTLNLKLHTN